jgi:pseudouridine-5'-phosphate glycosidase
VMAARDAVGDTAALLIANPLPLDKQLDPALHNQVLDEALAAADVENVRGKAVTPFLLAYMQRATEGKSVEVNLDVARGNIGLAAEIATAWAARAAKTADA